MAFYQLWTLCAFDAGSLGAESARFTASRVILLMMVMMTKCSSVILSLIPHPHSILMYAVDCLPGRLEQFIHKMMSQAENSSGTREEQMARKQEILEELQRVEQELKFRTQIAQDSSQPAPPPPSLECGEDTPAPPPSASLSESPPNISPSHEYVEQELAQKQAIAEQQRQEAQLQQQKEYYQVRVCL